MTILKRTIRKLVNLTNLMSYTNNPVSTVAIAESPYPAAAFRNDLELRSKRSAKGQSAYGPNKSKRKG